MRNILIIHETMNGGGAEKVLCDILANFDYERYCVDLLLVYKKGIHLNRIVKNVNVYSIYEQDKPLVEKILFNIKPLLDIWQKRKIKKIVKQNTYDTIISFMEGVAAKYHSFVTNYASCNISWIHCNLSQNHWSEKYWRSIKEESGFYQSLNHVFCVSTGAKSEADLLFHLLGNSSVLYNLIDWKDINKKANMNEVSKNKFTICNVGRLVSAKRQDRIIEIAKMLKKKGLDVDFWILGTGTLESELKNKALEYDVSNMVHFLGFQINPYPYIKAADLFLMTSDTEGYPLVICEALCLGKPIVSTNVTGVDELLANGIGVVCDFNVEEIVNEIIKLVMNADVLSTYADLSERKGLEFDKQTILNRIYSIIQ